MRFHRDQSTGLFSLVELVLRMGILFAGKTPPPQRLGEGLRALKFEFFADAENALMIAPKTRQARTWPPQGASRVVPMIQFSRFSVRRSRPARADCTDYSVMCVSSTTLSVSLSTFGSVVFVVKCDCLGKSLLVSSGFFASTPLSNATEVSHSSEVSPPLE